VIAETFLSGEEGRRLNPDALPACLVKNHGPFAWGSSCAQAAFHAFVLEYCAHMALITEQLGETVPAPPYLLDRHYTRKHGETAYYGQRSDQG
jgi:L-ribulose-5-phosphate 4-epimerase